MTRFYTTQYINKYQKLGEVLKHVYVLFWDANNHRHYFCNIAMLDYAQKNNYNWYTHKQIVFDTVEHEEEFLKYHHDAANLRATGYVRALNEDELLFEKRKGKWCWKK